MDANPAKTVMLGLLVLFVFAHAPGLGLLLGLGLLAARAMRDRNQTPTTHGSARLGDLQDAKAGGLLTDDIESVVLGRATWLGKGTGRALLLRLKDFTHLLTVAGTGWGKGVSTVIPNAFHWPRSLVATDKGFEVYRAVSAYRKRAYGQNQYRIDPTALFGKGGDGYNPLDAIDDASPSFFEDAWALAKLVVFRTGTEHDPHWNDSAEAIIAAFICFVCACERDPDRRNLITVRDLCSSPETYAKSLSVMKRVTSHDGILARAAGRLEFLKDKEFHSVMSTLHRHLNFLNAPGVAAVFAKSSFRAEELRSDIGASVYLPIVPGRTDVMGQFNRVVIGSILRAAARALPAERNNVLVLLDEAGQLGKIPALQEATVLFRGLGIRLWFIFQSLNQVREVYGESAQTLLDNLDTQQYFGLANATETAESLAKRIGDMTVADRSTNSGTSWSRSYPAFGSESGGGGSYSGSSGDTRSWIARKVLFPDEIARLGKTALVFHRNLPVLPVELVRYFDAPEFAHCRAPGTGLKLCATRPLKEIAAHFLLGLGVAVSLIVVGLVREHGVGPLATALAGAEGAVPAAPLTKEQQAIAAVKAEHAAIKARLRTAKPGEIDVKTMVDLEYREVELRLNLYELEGNAKLEAAPRAETAKQSAPEAKQRPLPAGGGAGGAARRPTARAGSGRMAARPAASGPKVNCPDPGHCPHSASPPHLHVCLGGMWCIDPLRCPHIGGAYSRRR